MGYFYANVTSSTARPRQVQGHAEHKAVGPASEQFYRYLNQLLKLKNIYIVT